MGRLVVMPALPPLESLNPTRFDSAPILKRLASASRALAELKGVAGSIPNQGILINTLGLQEAKDSSEIENIVTTHDELFKDDVLPEAFANPAAKEVLRYRQALHLGYRRVRETGLITANQIIEIQAELERNQAGFRKLPGTALKTGAGGNGVYPAPGPGGDRRADGRPGALHQRGGALPGRSLDPHGADPSSVREYPSLL